MKKTVLTCLIFVFTIQMFSQVYTGDLTLSTQSEIDAFTYSEIDGNLTIEESTPNEIVNLNNLNSLITISGNLIIQNNSSLINLAGLNNLTTIGGRFEVINNDSLINLSGINNLSSILRLLITDNPALSSIQDLGNLTGSLGIASLEGVVIENNDSLLNINNLNISQTRNLIIRNNAVLTTITSFANIIIRGDMFIEDNALLESIPDLNNANVFMLDVSINNNDQLTSLPKINGGILERLEIIGNDNIISLGGLENTYIGTNFFPLGDIYIHENDNLTTLEGLTTNLSGTSGFSLINNDALINIDVLNNFTVGVLRIEGNDSLTSLAPLSNYSGSILEIYGNDLLTNLDGLQNATSLTTLKIIGTNLSSIDELGANSNLLTLNIEDNPNLASLSVFSSLTSVGSNSNTFRIVNNDNIISLDGFENVTSLADSEFIITHNDLLEDFCAFSDLVNSNGVPTTITGVPKYFVNNNMYNPSIADFNNGNCATLSVSEFNISKISVYPIPTSDYLHIKAENHISNCDIYSLSGQKISSIKDTKVIDVNHLSQGVYFLKVTDNQKRTQTIRFIKE